MKHLVFSLLFFFLSSCNQTISLVHTEGGSDALLEDQESATPSFSPNLTIPLK